jgi:hypothetical protein
MTGAKGSNTSDLPCSPWLYRPHCLVKIAQQRLHPEVGDGAQQTRNLLAGEDGGQWVGLARQRDAGRLVGPVEGDGVEEAQGAADLRDGAGLEAAGDQVELEAVRRESRGGARSRVLAALAGAERVF